MAAAGSGWSTLGIAGKAALVGIGPFVSVGLFSMGAALPRLAQAYGPAPHTGLLTQLIGTVVAPVFALASPLAGRLVAHFGVRPVYIASVGLMAAGGAAPALLNNLYAILACRIMLALGVAGGFTAGMSGIARLPDAQRPAILGLNSFFGGAICLPLLPLVGALAQESWHWAFLTHLVLLPMAALALALPKPDVSADSAASTPHPASGLLAGLPLRLLVITGFVGWAMVASSMYSPFWLATLGITQPALVGQVLAAMSLCSLAGSGSYGLIQRRLGTPWLLRIGLGAMAAGCLLIALAQILPMAIAGMGLLGLGLAVYSAACYATAIDSVGSHDHVPAAMGVMTLCLYGSQLAFPLLSSILGTSAGPAAVFALLAGLMALSLMIALSAGPYRAAPAS